MQCSAFSHVVVFVVPMRFASTKYWAVACTTVTGNVFPHRMLRAFQSSYRTGRTLIYTFRPPFEILPQTCPTKTAFDWLFFSKKKEALPHVSWWRPVRTWRPSTPPHSVWSRCRHVPVYPDLSLAQIRSRLPCYPCKSSSHYSCKWFAERFERSLWERPVRSVRLEFHFNLMV